MQTFIGTKIINARPMTRGDYNAFRGRTPPDGEEQNVDGYLVEYTDGGEPNTAEFAGYVSWTPKAQFDGAYVEVPAQGRTLAPHQLRVVAEWAQLDDRMTKLRAFFSTKLFAGLDVHERARLQAQHRVMNEYGRLLYERIEAFE